MKEIYIDLMEKVADAYTAEHIRRYTDEVIERGLEEHGFPRLTANLGILIAHGRKLEYREIFLEMMNFLTKTVCTAIRDALSSMTLWEDSSLQQRFIMVLTEPVQRDFPKSLLNLPTRHYICSR